MKLTQKEHEIITRSVRAQLGKAAIIHSVEEASKEWAAYFPKERWVAVMVTLGALGKTVNIRLS